MAIVPRKRDHGRRIIYYITFSWNGKRQWERVGSDRTEAARLEKKRKREVKDGTYQPHLSPETTLATYVETWVRRRTNRTKGTDEAHLRRYVLTRDWLAGLKMRDVRPRHIIQLVEELKRTTSEATGKLLSHKTVSNIVGVLATLFRDARIEELSMEKVVTLPGGILRRSAQRDARKPYDVAEVKTLLTHPQAPADARVFAAVALMTGMREGEVCGRRWRDWDESPQPLGCLLVATQYDGQPLKTEWGDKGEHPRRIPVHPALASLLQWWRDEGFAAVYGRPPTPDDFIVPRKRGLVGHTKDTGYQLWRALCESAGVTNRTLHSTRHTFVSLCRRGGANREVLEKVTHNAKGDILDQYTHRDWSEACQAVLCLTEAMLTPPLTRTDELSDPKHLLADALGTAPGADRKRGALTGHNEESMGPAGSRVLPKVPSEGPTVAPHVNRSTVAEFLGDLTAAARAAVDGGVESAALAELARGAEAIDSGEVPGGRAG